MVSADITLAPGTQLNYRGSVEARVEQPGKGQKAFDLALWVLQKTDAGAEVFWLVDERGAASFPGPNGSDARALDAQLRTAGPGPALLYDRGDGRTRGASAAAVFGLPNNRWRPAPILPKANSSSTSTRPPRPPTGRPGNSACRDPFGPKRLMAVDQRSPLVLKMTDRLTMGRGEEYQLKLEFVSARTARAATAGQLEQGDRAADGAARQAEPAGRQPGD